jgi:hypothetical protein
VDSGRDVWHMDNFYFLIYIPQVESANHVVYSEWIEIDRTCSTSGKRVTGLSPERRSRSDKTDFM